jgi:LuxR family maltose regulon positive regulatory protein
MMKARLAIGREQAREAIVQLKAALQRAQEQQRFDSVISLLVLLALAYHIDGDTQQTLQSLDQALILGEPEYLRVFVDEGPAMAILLNEYYSRNQRRLAGEQAAPSMAYLHRLLSALGQEIRPAWLLAQTREERTFNSLSEREQMVLDLMAEGRSNQEIARALVVTVSTVKTHLNNIYAKLQVHTRLQAVTRAYVLGLLVRGDPETNTLPQLQMPRDIQLNA